MSKIIIKTPEEIAKMRIAGKLASEVLDYLTPFVKPGVTTAELDQLAHDYMTQVQGTTPATLGYHGFPKSICTSINHQVCHGIPAEDRVLKKGDILNIDVTVIKDGYHGDTSRMYCIGKASVRAERICRIARECLYAGIKQVKPGNTFADIALAIETHAKKNYASVVREYCGHGIGKGFHEPPQVLHYVAYNEPEQKILLEPGMVFTIEPMINLGRPEVKVLKDGWTVVTKDRSLSAQWEHTLAVTETGYEIFTLAPGERIE